MIHLSINSSYYCNFKCQSCYLTNEQLNDKKLLSLDLLEKRLNEIKEAGEVFGHADLYGGEVLLYPAGYLKELKDLLHSFGIHEIEVITNLSSFKRDIIHDEDFGISVSYDFDARENDEHVWKNILKIERPFTILTLANREILNKDVTFMINQLNTLNNLNWWEIKPYSPNQANSEKIFDDEFEEFIKLIITDPTEKKFELLNLDMLKQAVLLDRNSFSDDHVYITPSGDFGVLEFDLNDNEYFKTLDTFSDYLEWTMVEKGRVYENRFCQQCEYIGKCLSEHLRDVKSLTRSCNGYYKLIKWAEGNI